MNFGPILCALFVVILGVSLLASSAELTTFLIINAGAQFALFFIVAIIPYLRTGRMSYVDIAWPFGVALIGLQLLLLIEGNTLRLLIVSAVYLLIGLRMGLGAVTMAKATGVIFKYEFPRYQYRHLMFQQQGTTHVKLHVCAEIMAQGMANMSVLALPGLMIALNGSQPISAWELAGLAIWAIAYLLESTADIQKMKFIARHPKGVCNVGLWRFSRHPNYFSEWLVWTGLVIAAVPSWLLIGDSEPLFVWLVLGIGALCASLMLYITLVYLTGAKPAEYFSVQKRPDYKRYQETTSMFFPWFPKS